MPQAIVQLNALGTQWHITFQHSLPADIKKNVVKIIEDFEKRYSRFRPDSDIGVLNRTGCLINPTNEFRSLLEFGLRMYTETAGVFDMSVGSVLEKLGYGMKPSHNQIRSTDLTKDLLLSTNKVLLKESIKLDLGGFGKGWLVDKLASYLKYCGAKNVIINGGGDIFSDTDIIEKFFIEHPYISSQYLAVLHQKNGALATSSLLKRRWINNAREYHHIISPDNASSRFIQVSVRASTALIADTMATIFLLTDESTRTALSKNYNTEYMLVDSDNVVWKSAGFLA